ncbi:MAG: hypothetical protein JWP35_1093 [Caulobacter sp.]|nr:hypothetical protein [Caulobacter sp.]
MKPESRAPLNPFPVAGDAAAEPVTKGARTRSRIKTSVLKLLERKSYARLTVAEVCEAAGITVGGFYFHFRSHEELVDELVEEFITELTARLRAAMTAPVEGALQNACLAATSLYAEQPGVARAFQQMIRSNTAHAGRWMASHDDLCAHLGDMLATDAGGGEAKGWALMAHALIVAIVSELTRVYVYRDRAEGPAVPEQVARGVEALCARILAGGAPLTPSVAGGPPAKALMMRAAEADATGRGARTRTRIKAAFVQLLDERSHDAIGIVDICARAGVTVGGFYFHFKKKEALIAETINEYNEIYWAAMHAALDAPDPFAVVVAATGVSVDSYSGSPGLVRCINELALSDRSYAALWSRHAAQWSARFHDRVAEPQPSAAGADRSYNVLNFIDNLLFKMFVEKDPGLAASAGDPAAAAPPLAQIWFRAIVGAPPG